jgi:hypothetical protein
MPIVFSDVAAASFRGATPIDRLAPLKTALTLSSQACSMTWDPSTPKGRLLADAEVGLAPPPCFNTEALSSAALTGAIGLGITGAACLAVCGFFSGLVWVIAGFARD